MVRRSVPLLLALTAAGCGGAGQTSSVMSPGDPTARSTPSGAPKIDPVFKPAPGANSAAVIEQHMVGNLYSRFTDFLTTDGEKPTRNRDQEFEEPTDASAVPALQTRWAAAWQMLFDLLDTLQPADLLSTVTVRGEGHTVLLAIQRQVAHYAYHVGQLVQLAKHLRGNDWQTLSVPRGQSQQFNAATFAAASSPGHSQA